MNFLSTEAVQQQIIMNNQLTTKHEQNQQLPPSKKEQTHASIEPGPQPSSRNKAASYRKAAPKPRRRDQLSAATIPSADGKWKCVRCGCPEKLTPVKRLNSDGQRNLCNACYIRGRASKDRGLRGSARPNNHHHNNNQPYAAPYTAGAGTGSSRSVSPTSLSPIAFMTNTSNSSAPNSAVNLAYFQQYQLQQQQQQQYMAYMAAAAASQRQSSPTSLTDEAYVYTPYGIMPASAYSIYTQQQEHQQSSSNPYEAYTEYDSNSGGGVGATGDSSPSSNAMQNYLSFDSQTQ